MTTKAKADKKGAGLKSSRADKKDIRMAKKATKNVPTKVVRDGEGTEVHKQAGQRNASVTRSKGRKVTVPRNRMVMKDASAGITKADIRRLALAGGVKRMSSLIFEEIRGAIRQSPF